jgi:hypothetical protein
MVNRKIYQHEINIEPVTTDAIEKRLLRVNYYEPLINSLASRINGYISPADNVQKYRNDYDLFAQYVLKDDQGQKLLWENMQKSWNYHIRYCWEHNLHPVVIAPWRHGKTKNSIGRVLYHIGRDPTLKIKIVSNEDGNAVKRVKVIKKYIEEDSDYKAVFPEVIPDRAMGWSNHELYLRRKSNSTDPSIEAVGIKTTGIGGGANLLIFDDPVDFNNAILKPSERKTVLDLYDHVWMSRLEERKNVSGDSLFNSPRIIYIGTRWHKEDLTAEIMQREGYATLLQAIDSSLEKINFSVMNVYDDYDYKQFEIKESS